MADDRRNLREVRGLAGEMRRSRIITTAGPGAIIDLAVRGSGEPLSGVVAGLEAWDLDQPTQLQSTHHPQFIHERRLEQRYGVEGFRLPPVRPDGANNNDYTLPVVRFPTWLQCPGCQILKPESLWTRSGRDVHSPTRFCDQCNNDQDRPLPVVPVRLIVACEHGHLDEFPWQRWSGCTCGRWDIRLRLQQVAPGLAGLHLTCLNPDCPGSAEKGGGHSLGGVFSEKSMSRIGCGRCRGRMPWLGEDEECDANPRVLQRGASNVYWSSVDSALDIPPYSLDTRGVLAKYADKFVKKDPARWHGIIDFLELVEESGLSESLIVRYYEQCMGIQGAEDADDQAMRFEEYMQFTRLKRGEERIAEGEFRVECEPVPTEIANHVSLIGRATRLREVRVLYGFGRIYPPSGAFSRDDARSGRLSRTGQIPWLPGVDLRGEGIFLELNPSAVAEWEARPEVVQRIKKLHEAIEADLFDREEFPEHVTARFVMIHSLAHTLIGQLTLECGYSSSSLVERLYVGEANQEDMTGILIHTGSPDADGTLGGLVEQGRSELLLNTLIQALQRVSWCSSDPLCISGIAALSSRRNRSACHACLLLPETCCRHFNRYLDRALLIGTPSTPELGFFTSLLG